MITWVLTICTAGWVLCGQEREVEYPNEAACYRALNELYRRSEPGDFKYVTCAPKQKEKKE